MSIAQSPGTLSLKIFEMSHHISNLHISIFFTQCCVHSMKSPHGKICVHLHLETNDHGHTPQVILVPSTVTSNGEPGLPPVCVSFKTGLEIQFWKCNL